jgi:hypothetical protein
LFYAYYKREDLEERNYDVGAVYDLSAPTEKNISNPAGECNSYHVRIDYNARHSGISFNNG